MLRFIATSIAFLMITAFGGETASAKQCRDASGKFVKCSSAMAMKKKHHHQCRDASGKFIKCSKTKM